MRASDDGALNVTRSKPLLEQKLVEQSPNTTWDANFDEFRSIEHIGTAPGSWSTRTNLRILVCRNVVDDDSSHAHHINTLDRLGQTWAPLWISAWAFD